MSSTSASSSVVAVVTSAATVSDRGSLRIADKVVERIARQSALENGRVVAVGGRLEQVVGNRYPRVSANVAGDRVRVDLEIAITWPAPADDVSREVRTAVSERVGELTGMQVDAVDVRVAHFAPPLSQDRSVR